MLLVVIKNEGGGDNVFVLRRVQDHFESVYSMPCAFVQLTGKYKIDALDPMALDALPEWGELQHRETARTPFWWGGKGREWFMWQTSGIRSFLGVTEPLFRAFKVAASDKDTVERHYFGLWDQEHMSLVLAKDDELISYGSMAATEHLLHVAHRWIDLGMPTAASFGLRVFRSDYPLKGGQNEWVVKRRESQFLWSLNF